MWILVGKELNAKNMLAKCFRNASKKCGLLTKREVKMAQILAKFFFCVFYNIDRDEVVGNQNSAVSDTVL